MTVLFANFGYLQLTKHVAMFHNFHIDKSFVCRFEKGQKLSILETDNIVNFGN